MNTTTEPANLLDASADDLKAMGLPPAFTLEELQAHLTEAEIAKLAEGDDPLVKLPDAPENADAEARDDNDDDDDPDDEGDDADEGDGEGDDATKAEASDTAAAPETPVTAPADDTPDPVFQPANTTEAKATIEGAAAERKALRDAYNDGELNDDEFDAKMEELNDKIVDAKTAIKDAEKAEADSLAALQTAWFGKVDAFLNANPAFRDNTPNPKLEGNSYLTALDTVMKAVNQDARYAGMTMNQRIEASAKIVRSYVQQQTGADIPGLSAPAKGGKTKSDAAKPSPEATPEDARAAAKAKAAQQGKRPDPVQTLGNVTAATETEIEDSRFAAIDKAEGMDAEAMFQRMTPAEQRAFLRGA